MNNDQPKVKQRFPVGVHPVYGGPSFDHPPTVKILKQVAEVLLEDMATKLNDDDFKLMPQGVTAAKRHKPDVSPEDVATKLNDDDFKLMPQGVTDAKRQKPDVHL